MALGFRRPDELGRESVVSSNKEGHIGGRVMLQWHKNQMPGAYRAKALISLTGLFVGAITSCVYDSEDRCNKGQVVYEEGVERCVCDAGSAWTEGGCVECGEHEIAGPAGCTCDQGYGRPDPASPCAACGENEATTANGTCDCVDGFSRATADAACEEGVSTDPADDDTDTPPADVACTTDGDCADGSRCDLNATPASCRVAPTGFGQACASDADCAGLEAAYCDVMNPSGVVTCRVMGCTLSPENCYPGTECCDLSMYGVGTAPICVDEGTCPL